jgi:hypothetical protein
LGGDAVMSALKIGIWRRCARVVRSLFANPVAVPAVTVATHPVAPTFADLAFAEMNLLADGEAQLAPSIFIFCSIAELAAALAAPPASAVCAPAPAAQPARAATSQRTTDRPLAVQIAVTAARNVPKGQKSRGAAAPQARAVRAKPVVKSTIKKRAPKRRHVWLSNQSRVIRPVASNVVSLARQTRSTIKLVAQKSPARTLRLAA